MDTGLGALMQSYLKSQDKNGRSFGFTVLQPDTQFSCWCANLPSLKSPMPQVLHLSKAQQNFNRSDIHVYGWDTD